MQEIETQVSHVDDSASHEHEEINITPEALERIEDLAHLVGGDFGMKVKLGEVGEGSFFDPKNVEITLDPHHMSSEMAEMVVAHEGAHRATYRSPKQMNLNEELWQELGFGSLVNSIEDPAANSWVVNKYPTLRGTFDSVYGNMLKEDNVLLGDPLIHSLEKKLGYQPKFGQFNSEIIRYWATGRFSEKLDPDVEAALQKTLKHAQKAYKNLPGKYPSDKDVTKKARERVVVTRDKVWPEVRELIKKDLQTEEFRQMLKEAAQQAANPDSGESTGGGGFKIPEDLLDEELKKELDELTQQANSNNGEIPMDQVSDKLKDVLEKAKDRLPQSKKRQIEQSAKNELKEFEDAMNKGLEGKLVEEKAPSHEDFAERQTTLRQTQEDEAKANEILDALKGLQGNESYYDSTYQKMNPYIQQLTNKLQRIFAPNTSPSWQKGVDSGQKINVKEVMGYRADKSRFDRIWDRRETPSQKDYRFTVLVDLSGSMKESSFYNSDGDNYQDFGISKIENTFSGLVTVGEALDRVGVRTEIIGFDDAENEEVYKEYGNKLDNRVRQQLSRMVYLDGHGGSTDTAEAVEFAKERQYQNLGEHNFILVLTDGAPNDRFHLQNVLEELGSEGKTKVVGVGIGSGTEFVNQTFKNSLYIPDLDSLPRSLSDLFEDMISHPRKYQ